MFRKTFLISIVALFSSVLAGCHLYIEDNYNDDGTYQYCDDTGCYSCDEFGCQPNGEGWTCANNYNCESGCFCNPEGFCEEAGFCTFDNDCANGFECDDRSSCVPVGSNEACTADAGCPEGSYCAEEAGICVGSGVCDSSAPTADESCGMGFECDERNSCVPEPCTSDDMCQAGCYCDESKSECIETTTCDALGNCPGNLVCDTGRNTCVPADELGKTCQGAVSCDTTAPICPIGSTPAIESGCYTGECMAKSECPDGAPFECRDLSGDENACIANAACGTVYKGVNCTSPSGAECTSGSANCTCESFQFDYCEEV